MGIINAIRSEWNSSDTAGKINMVLDVICGFGAGVMSGRIFKTYAPSMNKVERVCASICMSGVGMALGKVATDAYKPYTKAVGAITDAVKARVNDQKKEANSHA